MKRQVLALALALALTSVPAYGQPESEYRDAWCVKAGGQAEVTLPDRTRVDCLTDEFAVEVDFAAKWAEAIGQSRYYAEMTGREPAVVLIVGPGEARFLARFHNAAEGLGIRLFVLDR